MFGAEIIAEVTQLTGADPATCDRAGLADIVTASQRVRCWLDALDVRVAVAASRLAEGESCETPGDVLAGGGRRSSRDAAAAARRGKVCDQLPKVHDALAAGAVSAGHVDAIARAAGELDDAGRAELADLETTIVASASKLPVEAFAAEMRELARNLAADDGTTRLEQLKQQRNLRRWVDRVTGMCHTHVELDPETDARVAAALDAARARQQDDDTNFEHLKVDALVDLITGARSTDRRIPEISVLIDLQTLLNGLHEKSVCETADGQHLPPETIRRLCCDGNLIPIVFGGDGVALDEGRAERLATREQRRALRAMYQTCAHPGCQVRFDDCRIHHVTWWEHFGPTDLANLSPLCERDHHLVHEGGWSLTLKPDRTITLRRPDGSLFFEGNTTTRPPAPAGDDEPLPTETNIPLHLRRAARPPQPAPDAESAPTLFAEPPPVDGGESSPGDIAQPVTGEHVHGPTPTKPAGPSRVIVADASTGRADQHQRPPPRTR